MSGVGERLGGMPRQPAVFGTGVATVAIGSASGRWAAIAHGIAGLVILLLVPWKSRVVKGGLRRGRHTRWVSLVLAALVVITFVAGLGYATGLVLSIAGKPGLWVHIAVALVLVPLLLWHIVARRIRPRRSDLLHGEVSYVARRRSWRTAAVRVSGSQSPGCSFPVDRDRIAASAAARVDDHARDEFQPVNGSLSRAGHGGHIRLRCRGQAVHEGHQPAHDRGEGERAGHRSPLGDYLADRDGHRAKAGRGQFFAALRGGNQLTLAPTRIRVSPPADGIAAVSSSAFASPAASVRGVYPTHSTVTVFVVPWARPSRPSSSRLARARAGATARSPQARAPERTGAAQRCTASRLRRTAGSAAAALATDGQRVTRPALTSRESICLASASAAAREPTGARVAAAAPAACAAGRDAAVPQPASIAVNASTATHLPRMATSQPRLYGT